MLLYVKTLTGKTVEIDVDPGDDITEVLKKLEEKLGCPAEAQRVIFAGKLLLPGRTVADYNVRRYSTFHLLFRDNTGLQVGHADEVDPFRWGKHKKRKRRNRDEENEGEKHARNDEDDEGGKKETENTGLMGRMISSLMTLTGLSSSWAPLHRNLQRVDQLRSHLVADPSSHPIDSDLFQVSLFNKEFCNALIEEVTHYQQYFPDKEVVELGQLGLSDMLSALTDNFLLPIIKNLYPGTSDHLRLAPYGFMAISKEGEYDDHKKYEAVIGDKVSSKHQDGSTFTLNFCLGKSFSGNELKFHYPDGHTVVYDHSPLQGVIHRGSHEHEVISNVKGERYNLVLWLQDVTLGSLFDDKITDGNLAIHILSNFVSPWNRSLLLPLARVARSWVPLVCSPVTQQALIIAPGETKIDESNIKNLLTSKGRVSDFPSSTISELCIDLCSDAIAEIIAANCKGLQKFTLRPTDQRLSIKSIYSGGNISDYGIRLICSKCHLLTSLTLLSWTPMWRGILEADWSGRPDNKIQLVDLNIGSQRMKRQDVIDLSQSLIGPQLLSLDLSGFKDQEGMFSFPSLRTLTLWNLASLSAMKPGTLRLDTPNLETFHAPLDRVPIGEAVVAGVDWRKVRRGESFLCSFFTRGDNMPLGEAELPTTATWQNFKELASEVAAIEEPKLTFSNSFNDDTLLVTGFTTRHIITHVIIFDKEEV